MQFYRLVLRFRLSIDLNQIVMPQLNTPQKIITYLNANSTLTELDLSRQELSIWDKNNLYELGHILKDSAVKKLDLSWNDLGRWNIEQIEALGNVLANTSLTHIALNRNNLKQWSAASLTAFSTAIQGETFNFSGNDLQFWTKEHINTLSIQSSIDLSWNQLDKWSEEHFYNFSQVLTKTLMKHLHWGGNDFHALTARNIQNFQFILKYLTGFHLNWNRLNQLTCTQINELGSVLKKSHSLIYLDLAANKLGSNTELQQQACHRLGEMPMAIALQKMNTN